MCSILQTYSTFYYFHLFRLLFQAVLQFCIFFTKHINEVFFGNKWYVFLCDSNIPPLSVVSQKRPILIINIKVNPRPNLDPSQNFIICHWNLNSAQHVILQKKKYLKSIFDNSLKRHGMLIWNLSWFFITSKWWKRSHLEL